MKSPSREDFNDRVAKNLGNTVRYWTFYDPFQLLFSTTSASRMYEWEQYLSCGIMGDLFLAWSPPGWNSVISHRVNKAHIWRWSLWGRWTYRGVKEKEPVIWRHFLLSYGPKATTLTSYFSKRRAPFCNKYIVWLRCKTKALATWDKRSWGLPSKKRLINCSTVLQP